MDENQQNNEEQKSNHFDKLFEPDNIRALGDIFERFFVQWKEANSEKTEKIYRYSTWNRNIYYFLILIIFGVLSFLLFYKCISETIYATLISSIIGYVIGRNSNESAKK